MEVDCFKACKIFWEECPIVTFEALTALVGAEGDDGGSKIPAAGVKDAEVRLFWKYRRL